jgi:uncharacterized protein
MTPQEQQLVADLFDRLASLEGQQRDGDAERVIREGLGRAPNAVYALVQSVLVQDEALKRANARIEELEHAAAGSQPARGGFLDSMRNALTGERSRGSVPSVRPGGQGTSGVWGARPDPAPPAAYAAAPYAAPMASPMGAGMMPGSGSFLGTAAAAVAGVIGGGLMLDGIRSMMGGHHAFMGDYERMEPHRAASLGDAGSGDLGREAGLNDVGGQRSAAHDNVADNSGGSGFFGSGDDDQPDDNDADNDADGGGDYDDGGYDGGGSDTA